VLVKVAEAKGATLDWMVCRARHPHADMSATHVWLDTGDGEDDFLIEQTSTDWAQGGPIIDREKISIRQWTNVPIVHAYMPEGEWSSDGESPLIAAMRCLVVSRLGEEVEVPDGLS